MAKEKVTVTFGGLDPEEKSIIIESPIELYKTVKNINELNTLSEDPDFIKHKNHMLDEEYDGPDVIVYVEKIEGQEHNKGGYFRYNPVTGSWRQILIGTHTHDNKQLLDKLSEGDIGQWIPIHKYPSVKLSDEKPFEENEDIEDPLYGYDANTGALHLYENGENSELYSAVRHNKGLGKYYTTWHKINLTIGEHHEFPQNANEKDIYYQPGDERHDSKLYLFTGVKSGEQRVLMMEVTETGVRSDYNLNWVDLPERMPDPIIDDHQRLYLSVDRHGNKEWVNNVIPGQSFQILSNGSIEGNSISFSNVNYNEDYDEVLVFSKILIAERSISYTEIDKSNNQLTISFDNLDEGYNLSELTILLIRNTAQALIDELTRDYVTREELELGHIRGGRGSRKLRQEINKKADKDHIHTGYANKNHNHDGVYAPIEHTHSEYMTRGGLLKFLAEQDQSADKLTDLIDKMIEVQNEIDQSEYEDLKNVLINRDTFNEYKSRLQSVEESIIENLNKKINSSNVQTNYVNSYRENKTLDVVLEEIFQYMSMNEISGIQSDEVSLGSDIEVTNSIGYYQEGYTITEDTPLQDVLRNMLTEGENTNQPTLEIEGLQKRNYIEMGNISNVVIKVDYDSGGSQEIEDYRITVNGIEQDVEFSGNKIEDTPIEIDMEKSKIEVVIELSYSGNGKEKTDVDYMKSGKLKKILFFYPRRALYYGQYNGLSSDSIDIRNGSHGKIVIENYRYVDYDLTFKKGDQNLFIAVPKGHNLTLDHIIYKTFNQDIRDNFNIVEGELNFLTNTDDGIEYNIYTYELPTKLTHNVDMRIVKGEM